MYGVYEISRVPVEASVTRVRVLQQRTRAEGLESPLSGGIPAFCWDVSIVAFYISLLFEQLYN